MKARFDIKAIWTNYFSSINAIIRASLGVGVVVLFIVNYISNEPVTFFKRLELLAYDTRLRSTMPAKIDPRIVIIDIDEKTLAAEGRWPLARDKWVLLIRQLFDVYKVKVAGFDVLFTEPDTSSGLSNLESLGQNAFKSNAEFQDKLAELRPQLDFDKRFAEEIKKHAVVLAFASSNDRNEDLSKLELGALPAPTFTAETFKQPFAVPQISGYSANLPALQNNAAATGHIIPTVDIDGVLRRVPIFIKFKDGYYDALSIAVYRTFLDNEPERIILRENEGDGIVRLKSVQFRDKTTIPIDDEGAALIPYRGKNPMFRYISATDVMRGRLTPGELEGKIAFIGTSAQGLFDLRNTPVNEIYPGVEVHANMVSGYMDNNLKRAPAFEGAIKVITILLIGLPLAIALVKLNPILSTATVVTVAALLVAFNMYWWNDNLVLPVAMPLLMIGILYLLNMAYGFFIESRSKRQITGIFGTYVPKELVEEMAKNPANYSTQGESRDMTVLFSDVRNFTSISEGLTATELTAMMNAYLTEMTQTIQAQRGTIDKYIGDAIMAFWGAPLKDEKHAEHALLSALAMQKRIREIGPDFIKRGWPRLEIGVGLNCGVMNVGDMGSTFRRAYTVMGDHVNLASRLESLTKEYGVGILVSENIVNTVQNVVYRELDRVRVKGKLEPISIYEPVGIKGEVADQVLDEIDRFHRALDRYKEQRWDDAERLLVVLSQADPQRKVYRLYLDRVANLRMSPPGKNWDGVFTFTTK
ncbi:MAG TPA: CHASE2 domain-containing protein [Usitatibacteraceae bacterium]